MTAELFTVECEYKDLPLGDFKDLPDTIKPSAQMILSIKKHGVLEPILMRGKTLVAGRRRVKAAIKAGLLTIPARIFPDDFGNEYILSLVENEQRKTNPISDLLNIEALLAQGKSEDDICVEAGISRQRYRKIRSVDNLLPDLRRAMMDGVIKYTVAETIAKKPKTLQEKCLKVLTDEGVLKLKDVHRLCKVERRANVSALPDNLFGDVTPNWKPDTLRKLNEIKDLTAKDADPEWLDALTDLIDELM